LAFDLETIRLAKTIYPHFFSNSSEDNEEIISDDKINEMEKESTNLRKEDLDLLEFMLGSERKRKRKRNYIQVKHILLNVLCVI
jgi:hypothetical protein